MVRYAVTYVIAGLIAVGLLGCSGESSDQGADPVTSAYRNLDPDVAYVGREACRSCHVDKYETFVEAQMGRSIKPAHPGRSAARFEGVEPVYDETLDLYYEPLRRGDDLFIVEYRLAGRDTVHKRVEQIDYIVGSGQHTNSHIMSVNGYLYQMPLTWYAQDGRWDLPPGFGDGNNSRFDRPIPEACMTCHNAMPGFVEGSENKFTHVPAGIDCERCHGPGELHIEEKMAGIIVDTSAQIDPTIVNPAKLPLDRQFDVCQRCHMQGATIYKEGMGPHDFRPGMKLSDVMNVFMPRYADSTERFIMASHPDRLQMSECFTGSHEEGSEYEPMTCTTCHDPHVSIETLGADHYRATCLSCHASGDEPIEVAGVRTQDVRTQNVPANRAAAQNARPQNGGSTRMQGGVRPVSGIAEAVSRPSAPTGSGPACAEDLAAREAVGDNCVQCHMPVSGSADIPHVSITDHFIRTVEQTGVPLGEADVEAAKNFVGLASLIDASPTMRERAEGYMTYFEEVQNRPDFLDSAAVLLDRSRAESSLEERAPSLVRLYHLQRDFDATVRLSRDLPRSQITDAWTLYRIGEALQATGSVERAILYFEKAVEQSSHHLRFLNKLGMAYTEDRRLDEALATFDRVLSVNPKHSEARNNRGFVRIMQQDFARAEADFLQAIELNPDAEMALANLASLYVNTNRVDEARPYARRLAEEHPDDPNYQRLWQFVENGGAPAP